MTGDLNLIPPPENEAELMARASALAGYTLGELALRDCAADPARSQAR
ncbi:DNA mismatch repair protein MutH [Erwinia aphidicola]